MVIKWGNRFEQVGMSEAELRKINVESVVKTGWNKEKWQVKSYLRCLLSCPEAGAI